VYRTCIFCAADLGANEALEEFPVGGTVAFDAWKGRLWAVCPRCARWNLAPIEERWEAIESADRIFTDSRLRVQSENVGLARLPDGTRLIRIGQALPGELAAWRYGSQLAGRRRRYLVGLGVAGAAAAAVVGVQFLVIGGAGLGGLVNLGANLYRQRQMKRVIHRLSGAESPTGREVVLRSWHLHLATLASPAGGEGIELYVPDVSREMPRMRRGQPVRSTAVRTDFWGRPLAPAEGIVLPDPVARRVLGKAMVHVNRKGASRKTLGGAVELLSAAPSAEAFLRNTARAGRVLAPNRRQAASTLRTEQALALEMALHEETERRALEGELALLEAAWREAEEIAAIADALPEDPLDRLRGREG
jgi:hypothetical protein